MSHAKVKRFVLYSVHSHSNCASLRIFRGLFAKGGDFIRRGGGGLLKMPTKLVLLSDLITGDGVHCRNTSCEL